MDKCKKQGLDPCPKHSHHSGIVDARLWSSCSSVFICCVLSSFVDSSQIQVELWENGTQAFLHFHGETNSTPKLPWVVWMLKVGQATVMSWSLTWTLNEVQALWSCGKERRCQKRLDVGGRPFQVQTMTRKLAVGLILRLLGWGVESQLCCFWPSLWPWLRSKLSTLRNYPQKNGSYMMSVCQRGVLFQTLTHYIKGKKKVRPRGRKETGGCAWRGSDTFSWNRIFLRLFWAQFQEEVLVIKTNNH